MSFLDSTPDLTGRIFTLEQLKGARRFFLSEIPGHVPSRLKKPIGELRHYWEDDSAEAACYLMNLCWIIGIIKKHLDSNSQAILDNKFTLLLKQEGKQYEQTLIELEVLASYAQVVDGIMLEPISEEESTGKTKNHNVDFRIDFENIPVYFDVTMMSFQKLEDFIDSTSKLSDLLIKAIFKSRKRRIVELDLPLVFRFSKFKQEAFETLIKYVLNSDNGRLQINWLEHIGFIEWKVLPHLESDKEIKSLPPNTRYWTLNSPDDYGGVKLCFKDSGCFQDIQYNYEIGMPVAVDICPLGFTMEDKEDLVKSLRNTLNQKRRQFRLNYPLILIMSASEEQFIIRDIMKTIAERIWSNPDYQWLSGIQIYIPTRNFQILNSSPSFYNTFNPNATNKIPQSLINLITQAR